jgi:hypothetical protein
MAEIRNSEILITTLAGKTPVRNVRKYKRITLNFILKKSMVVDVDMIPIPADMIKPPNSGTVCSPQCVMVY